MKVLLIGTGRVAGNIALELSKSGVELIGVAGRNGTRTAALAAEAGTVPYSLAGPLPMADLMVIAVKDDAISQVAEKLDRNGQVVVHTSGASSMDLLLPHEHRGVMWPVQTFISQKRVPLLGVPMICEGSTERARDLLGKVAGKLSTTVLHMEHRERQRLHLAAVLASNFPVLLMHEAQRLLKMKDIHPGLLLPLWNTMAKNVAEMGTEQAITGPARRRDQQTIVAHLDLLNEEKDLQQLYELMSRLISERLGAAAPPDDLA